MRHLLNFSVFFVGLFGLGLVGCKADSDDLETGSTDSQDTQDTYQGCDSTEIHIIGDSPPLLGESWTIWMKCDGAILQGPMVLRFDPLDFATIDENVVTFQLLGTGEMTVQVGAYRETMQVTVEE